MYHRIMLFGRPGSGKSIFAFKLHQKTRMSLYHLDYFYTDNWVERDYQEFLSIQESIIAQDQWIIDGNSLKSLEMRYERAQVCLYFNYPRWLCLWRLIKRLFIKDQAMRWNLIKYMWTFEYRHNNRLAHQIRDLQERYPQVKFIEIRNDQDLKNASELFY